MRYFLLEDQANVYLALSNIFVEEEEGEEEEAYADLEYLGKVRSATGSIVKREEESAGPTYATITEFQKVEETEEQFDFTDV